ncbi:bifunctional UDP-N-acetylglucosamine diphosphorylase/glucosamine-1-phosphate N-acetyltransferase GlmU [Palleronia sp. LCG004]|uniref:bifunctional UDP-N-acetylglucosamine diphosphorylase/glucosamine-1-phosphate N-acetyltransferase GlmU n=1 Tax=Palleronia sp. LCG004 TaxID=3079304 RepID=UPI00294201CB|nr:bifunctional UDP-N-acetylglucosamine diphosphorylase/glucosamine-1-phosphate N-acetyltransferase GlmU [Palleronia sp. LCG004]WOI54910.1 bifunctional UDP-N-acetylglucosamine diphosphorylase/glucosamine-1-phosphate N-acetyltransferase GlmU [Palleronia sp. LCG004]
MATHLIVLAAGAGTRMKSDLPKVLHEVAHAPLFVHALGSAADLSPERRILVAGHGADAVKKAARSHDPALDIVIQSQQRGTAHAVAQAREAMAGATGDVFVLYGDTPFIRPETLRAMVQARRDGAGIVVLGFEAADPGRYGRLLLRDGRLERIVEYKDATDEERSVTLCNSGVICADAERLFELIDRIGNDNASGEYYLTDIVAAAREAGLGTAAVTCDEAETMGVNTRAELARAEALFQARAREAALGAGVTLTAPETVHFAYDTRVAQDVTIEPHVIFGPGVTIESGARIRAFSHLEGARVAGGAVIGPYARLRPGTDIAERVRIGNFVETKNARIHDGAKVNHLSYVGDAEIGAAANLGAGTITCNYDGVFKHRTTIGDNAFIGSNTMLVAPVSVGRDAMTASGSVVTMDVPDGAMAVARARQQNKDGFARRFMDRLRAAKNKDRI